MEVVSKLFSSLGFLFVFEADLQCDVFYWITGFTLSFMWLKKIHSNSGFWWTHPARIFFERVFRLLPLYAFMIFFLWQFIHLLGGAGPRFYMFTQKHGCQETWFYHMLFLNNVIPWADKDYCLNDSWYLANDIWFMIIALNLVEKYYKSKKIFFIYSTSLGVLTMFIQMYQIFANDFSPNYLTFRDEYWTLYYKKPFPHFHSFNIGMTFGCLYFTFKYQEFKQGSLVSAFFKTLKNNKANAISMFILGFLLQAIVCILNKFNNNHKTGFVWNFFFLILSRPIFAIGHSFIVLPLIMQNKGLEPVTNVLSHKYWIPLARLSYGVFLCNSIFMEFREFNLQHGEWVQGFNMSLLFLSFLALSFCFSTITYLFVEAPMANLLNALFVANTKDKNDQFFHSQSAKAHLRNTRGKKGKKRQPKAV